MVVGVAVASALVLSLPGAAQDLARERRLAAEIVDFILDGEPLYLEADGARFLGIYTEAELDRPRGGALVLHGRGFHPDWEQVVSPLRTALPKHGWSTLSLQMPVLRKEAKYYDYVPILPASFPRIRAGIDFLREHGAGKVVIIAHSCSVHMTMAYVDEYGDGEFDAYVGIGMGATDYGQKMIKPFPLERMHVPVLDLHGTRDYPGVLRMAPRRLEQLQAAGNPLSRQLAVPGADHYFTDEADALVEAVVAWLATLPEEP